MKYVVKFNGVFGFMKPFNANRDNKIKSLDFLPPSTLMGIEKKLFPDVHDSRKMEKIVRYRLDFDSISYQQEETRSITAKKKKGEFKYNTSIISRGVMINPVLYLMFDDINDAKCAQEQTICLSRNEDILLGGELITYDDEESFNEINGYESFTSTEEDDDSIYCGRNRYDDMKNQYVKKVVFGEPTNISLC